MNTLLDRLCDVLDEELVRQETVLAICRGKHDAIRSFDVEALEARTAALDSVLRETFEAETERHGILREAIDHLGLPQEDETLTGLIGAVQEPWKSRLQHFQRRLKETLGATQAVTRAYTRELRHCMKLSGRQFVHLGLASEDRKAGIYGPGGDRPRALGASSALVNQKG